MTLRQAEISETKSMNYKNIDTLDFIKIKNFSSNDNVTLLRKMKRKATDWEKIFIKHYNCTKYLNNL